MDLRYERLRYFLDLTRRTGTGLGCYERWHLLSKYGGPREDRYKNIDRTTIRDPRVWCDGLGSDTRSNEGRC